MSKQQSASEATLALSVVVISFNGAALLHDCLAALISQPDFQEMEVHVISKAARRAVPEGLGGIAQIHWHQVPTAETVPEMRSLGIMHSSAGLIALLEDDCVVGPHWSQSLLSAHQSDYPAVGGAIEPGPYTRGLDWGVFYCEYARFLLPFSGCVAALPGNNVSYKSKALDGESIQQGFYEVFIHDNWRKSGIELYAAADMVANNNNTWTLKNCTSIPFHHGRAYAGQRFGNKYGAKRLLYGLLATILPVIKSLRTLRQVISRQRTELPLLKALPWIIIFHSCWSLGEFIGYLTGPGGSIEKWS